jgi:2-polyprenyl-6-methoxyphenol hydroxylase-like FAD-dependent oxidoreductase
MTSASPDIVIVGGGIGGGALATVLARDGIEIVVLERETVFPDRVRGEWIAPWGVAEAKRLDLFDLLHGRGGLTISRNVLYDEIWPPNVAEQHAMDMTVMHPEAPGALCIGHPLMTLLLACLLLADTVVEVAVADWAVVPLHWALTLSGNIPATRYTEPHTVVAAGRPI